MSWLLVALLAFSPAATAKRSGAIAKMNEGIKLAQRGNTSAAERTVKEAIGIDPKYAKAHHTLGLLLRKQDKLEQAENAMQSGLEVVGEDTELAGRLAYELGGIRLRRAEAEGNTQRQTKALMKEAIAAFDIAIDKDPGQYKAHYRRAVAHDRLDEPDAADADYRKCIELRPQYSPCFVDLAQLYIDYGFANVGVAVLEVGVAVNDKDAQMYLGLGRAMSQLRKYEDAVDALKKAKAIDPDMPEVHFQLGMAYAEQSKRREAIESLQNFLHRAGSDVPEIHKKVANNTIARMEDVI